MNYCPPPSFGTLLKAFRKRRNLTQQQLAEAVGVHRNAIGRWEQGDFHPESKGVVLELARKLQLDIEEGRQLLEASFVVPATIWNVLHRRNPFFTGRKERLDELYQCLRTDRVIALTQSYALHGLGGIGKTQLAVEYAYRYALEYTAVLWIEAETSEHIITSFLGIADLLKLPECRETDQQRVVSAVQRWLASQGEWLLIWDDLEDIELLQRYLPPSRQGAILITTHRRSLGTLAQGIELAPMTQEEGVLFLLRRAKILGPEATSEQIHQLARPAEYEAASELVRVMGGLPLALDQAGAYIEETGCSVTSYLRLYREQCGHLLDRRGTPAGGHPQSVVATLLLAYQRIEQVNPAAAELLCLCAFLHPDSIPEELIEEGAALMGPTLQVAAKDPYQLDQAIAVLRSFSLIKRSPEMRTLSIHRLVQAVLKGNMDDSTLQQWGERVVRVLNAAFPSGEEVEKWSQCQRYLAHVEAGAQLIKQWKQVYPEAGQLLQRAGVYVRRRAQYTQAEQWLSQALAIRRQMRGTQDLETAESLNALAILYRIQGKYEEASSLYLQALSIREQILGTMHPYIAETLNNLALLYWSWGRYKEAEPLFQSALQILEHQPEMKFPDIASTLNNLALLYWSWERYKEAEPLFQSALQTWEQHQGAEHPNMAIGLNNLARLYADQGRYEQAEPLHQRALHIRELQLGPEHPETAISLNSLARVYADQGKYEQAEPLYQRALRIRELQLGPEHPSVATTLNCLAKLYAAQGKYEQAESLFLRSLTIREQCLGSESPATAESRNDLAVFYQSLEKYEKDELRHRHDPPSSVR